ncbi:MAG: hypothetical protein HON98_13730 [Chloroflexi bacterium]|nr:hypothetical protein [Chloroflexota bacterium]MBT3671080.1 hypothetical protein [Chloroflexota bacterium]MBT4003046.1 hypothetical protein [Chloroflexota bacterium]MBT4304895.1 hypothetical protein [Chloroflexota bacterium]MBT4534017.1 hypothetical protein [Chloroflexota bacterium]
MKTLGKWSYLVGLVVVIVTALISYTADWLNLVLVILAVLTGLFLGDTEELTNYGVRYLTLFAVAAALNSFPFLGEYVTTITHAMLGFFGPIVLTVLLVFNYKQAMNWARSSD